MNGVKAIIAKELRRVFFDKKMVFSLFVLPAILVIGVYFLMGQLMSGMMEDVEEHVGVIYLQNAPEEVKAIVSATGYDKATELTYLEADAPVTEIESGIQLGAVDLLVVFEDKFMENARAYQNAGDVMPKLLVCYNTTGSYSSAAANTFGDMILTPLETQMLTERFGNLELLTVFQMETKIIVDEDKANGEFISMLLPYFITFMLFVGAMSLGVDAIAGEKERGTMASMLLSPIKRQQIVFGKLGSLAILSALSAVVYAGAMLIAMPMMADSFAPGEEIPISVNFSALQIIQLLILMVVMVYLYVAVVAFVAVIAKSSKEANSYVSPIYIVVLLCGMLTMFSGGTEKALETFAIPVYGNALAIQNLMTNELSMEQFLLSVGGTLLCGIIFTVLLTKAFNSEKVMFNA